MKNINNTNSKFEQLLKSEADNHKMYPSEMVWENIRTELHGNRSWPALTLITLLIIVSLTVITLYNYPPDNITIKSNPVNTNNIVTAATANTNTTVIAKEDYAAQINPNRFTEQTIQAVTASLEMNDLANEPTVAALTDKKDVDITSINTVSLATINKKQLTVNNSPLPTILQIEDVVNNDALETTNTAVTTDTKKSLLPTLNESIANENGNNSTDDYLKIFGAETKKKNALASKWSWQLYITPSVSYRKLEDDLSNAYSLTTGINNNLNSSVHHKPALGYEAGVGFAYNITKNFKVVTGLQFNIRQYYIDAYKSYGLATFAFVQNNRLDSVSLFATFGNNNNGLLTTKLDNKLYQVAIPIGFEWNFLQGKTMGVSIGASIQPTFTLNKNIYMISNDYKYYADGESFFRKWNYNSSAQLIFNYKIGNTTLFLGPQIRYQHLPTYNDVYSIKEHRLDYGLKIGITKPL